MNPLTTERLVLRAPRAEDAAAVAALMSPEISQWLASWPPKVDQAWASARIADARDDIEEGRGLHWLVEDRADSRPMGWVRITRI